MKPSGPTTPAGAEVEELLEDDARLELVEALCDVVVLEVTGSVPFGLVKR